MATKAGPRPKASRRAVVETVGITVLVVVAGALVSVMPAAALACAGLVVIAGLSRVHPVALLGGVVTLTAIVPYGVQQRFGAASPGLLPSDVLLLAGLVWAVPRLRRVGMNPRIRIGTVLIVAFIAVAAFQVVRALMVGRDLSAVGYEFRVLLGFSAFLITIPVLADDRLRGALLAVLPYIGLALGVWGLAQWVLNIEFSEAADAGVRAGVRLTSSGRGQLQGGLFAYPVAALIAMAAWMAGAAKSVRGRAVLAAIILLSLISLVLTYERTFWVATAAGACLVVFKAGAAQRLRAVLLGGTVLLAAFAALATVAPNELSAARERLLSIGQYGSDLSVKYRIAESRHVIEEIRNHPLLGEGLNASIFFGRPWDLVAPQSYTFAHNGYLWLAWRVGIPAALLLLTVFFWSMRLFQRPRETRGGFAGVQTGSRAALFTLALASVTFPSFNQLGITATMGMLMAIGLWPAVAATAGTSSAASSSGRQA